MQWKFINVHKTWISLFECGLFLSVVFFPLRFVLSRAHVYLSVLGFVCSGWNTRRWNSAIWKMYGKPDTTVCCMMKWKRRRGGEGLQTTALLVILEIGPVCFVRLSSVFLCNYTSRELNTYLKTYLFTHSLVLNKCTEKKRKAMGFRFAFDFCSLLRPMCVSSSFFSGLNPVDLLDASTISYRHFYFSSHDKECHGL